MSDILKSILDKKNELSDSVSILKYFLSVFEKEINSKDFAFVFNSKIISKSNKLKSEIKKHLSDLAENYNSDSYKLITLDSIKTDLVINQEIFIKNENVIQLLLVVLHILHENITTAKQNKESQNQIDSKVEQLSQLYELSKEFSGILELEYVSKLLVFSIVGQFLVNNFAVLYLDKELKVLESKIDEEKVEELVSKIDLEKLNEVKFTKGNFPKLRKAGFELILPMQIQNETKGLILLGEKKNKEEYSKSDIEYINSVGSLAIISIENAVLFKEALEKQAIERDLETARVIQKNLLPHEIVQPDGYEIAAYSESAKQVGGDYFDLLKTESNETIFAIGDVSGKGITASLLVANSQAYLKSISKLNLPIAESTNLLNDLVSESTISGTYITFFWGKLNLKKEMSYVNAGHNPPLLIRDGKMTKLEKGGLILGMMKTMLPYESETIQLEKGDYIIAFTDGVTEAMNSNEEEYSDEALEKLCISLKNESAEETKEKILNDVKNFTSGYEQSDDLTLLVIKVK